MHNYTSTYVRKQGYNWTKKHWYEHVPKSVETGQGGNVTILWNHRNVIKKESEKILKYKDLTIEVQRMWNVKAKVIPVIIRATGTISKSLGQYLRATYLESKKLRNCKNQPYCALHTNCGKC